MVASPFAGCSSGETNPTGAGGSTTGTGGATTGTGGATTGTGGAGGAGGTGGTGGGMTLVCDHDGVVEPPEQCDDGNEIAGDGCDPDCDFSCLSDVDCDDDDPCNGAETCDLGKHACTMSAESADGTACGADKICKKGVCADITCGDAFVDPGEECDDGDATSGDGCDACKFSCVAADPTRDCTPPDPCQGKGVCNDATHLCGPAKPLSEGASCAPSAICKGGVCVPASCGDGTLSPGEQCEPPNTPTCDASCKTIIPAVCGNGAREVGEQCDDGNKLNLDGCDASCAFEQNQRITWIKMQFGTDAFCPTNTLGGAVVSGTAQSQLETSLDGAILDGTTTVLFKMIGLDDLTGTSDAKVELGVMNGAPSPKYPPGGVYDGANDLDWWYKPASMSIDANRDPVAKLAGSISAKVLTAGPGSIALDLLIAGSPASMRLSSTKMRVTLGAISAPKLAAGGQPPGHLASEHLAPGLVSYQTSGQPNANGAGLLCGNVSALSLSQVPVPPSLQGSSLLSCAQAYSADDSLLDLFVNGCTVLNIQQIKPAQPDTTDPGAVAVGTGGPYKLVGKPVSACKDKNDNNVDLQTCLKAAAYSSFFKFASGRVIVK